MLLHATTLSLNGHGVVLLGPPGSGKSDLALRLLETAGADFLGVPVEVMLVADDQTDFSVTDGKLLACPPLALQGLLEVRGLGIMRVPHVAKATVAIVVELTDQTNIERMPETEAMQTVLAGVTVPKCQIDPRLPGAVARIKLALLHAIGLIKSA